MFLCKYSSVSRKKFDGVLGIQNLLEMNRALIAKWCFRFKDPTVTGLWKQIIIKMYKRKKMYSPFSNGVVSEKHNIELGCKYFVGNVWIYFFLMIDVYVTVHWHTYIQLCLQLAMNRRLLWLKLWNMIV